MKKKTPFRRSIWKSDSRYDHSDRTIEERRTIGRLAWINAAKINVAPIAPEQLVEIGASIKRMPKANIATYENVTDFLNEGIAHEGAGIPILICMLAAETVDDGDYPPIDRKVVNGLKRHNAAAADRYDLIAASMAGSANRRRVRTFSEVYVREVIPVWQKLRVRKSAAEADNYLANKGSEKKR